MQMGWLNMFLSFLKTLRGKVIVLACLISFFTAAIIGAIYFKSMKEMALDNAIDNLAGETRLFAEEFGGIISAVKIDVEIVSRTPPISGIYRSEITGIDPLDRSTYSEWQTRLGTIFRSIMTMHPMYMQMRYIGIADDGREIVRVNRTPEGLEFVEEDRLQQKGKRGYFLEALTRKSDEIFFTDVEYNIEHDQVIDPNDITLRAIKPIYKENEQFGFLVLNIDYLSMLKKGLEVLDSDKQIMIANQNGDYLLYDPVKNESLFQFHQAYDQEPPSFIETFTSLNNVESVHYEESDVIYFVKKYLPGSGSTKYIGIALKVPKDVLLKEAYAAAFNSMLIGFLLVLASTALTAFFVHRYTRPWEELTNEVLNVEEFEKPIVFDIDCQDEIGKLANAFQELANKLVANRSKSKLILDTILDGVVVLDHNWVIRENNPAFDTIFGLKPGGSVGKTLDMFIPGQPLEILHRKDMEGINAENVRFPIELSITDLMYKNHRLYIGIIRDITERKSFEHKLIEANKEYETLTYITSHDLRSPLINLKGFSTELEKYIQEIHPIIKDVEEKIDNDEKNKLREIIDELLPEAVRFIKKGVDRIDSMTQSMLHLSRTGKRQLQFTIIHTTMLVNKCKDIFGHQIAEKGIEVIVHPLPDIIGDPLGIEQVFSNLFDNSIKYSAPDRKGIIEICGKEFANYYEFSFSDNGLGIDQKEAEKVFAVFKRASNVLQVNGEGMGMSYVKTLIQRHEGKIRFQSEINKGTTFIFTIGKLKVDTVENTTGSHEPKKHR